MSKRDIRSGVSQCQTMPVHKLDDHSFVLHLCSPTGTCQKYKQEGASCVSYEVLNGFCGCASGLSCRSVYVGTPSPSDRATSPRHAAGIRLVLYRDRSLTLT